MTIRIQTSNPAIEGAASGGSSRQQTPASVGAFFSALQSGDSDSIQKALTNMESTFKGGMGGLAQFGRASQGAAAQNAAQSVQTSSSSTPSSTQTTTHTTTQYAPLSIKSIYGEPPAGLDRSGLSGIIDKNGHNLSNKEIADFFDSNPSTSDISKMASSLGLNQYQEGRALSIWRGTTYVEPVWVPKGASTIGGTAGGETTGNGPAVAASGAWGSNASTLGGEYAGGMVSPGSSATQHFIT